MTIESEGRDPGGNYVDPVDSSGDGRSGDSGAAIRRLQAQELPARGRLTRPDGRPSASRAPTRAIAANADHGVDINRNYGVEWGGPGTGTNPYPDPDFLTYHGPEPWSEPETRAFRDFVREHPADRPDHEPHVHRPDAPPAGHRALRPGAGRGAAAGAWVT